VAPVIFEAAKRISVLCSGVGNGSHCWRGAGTNTRVPHKRVGRQKSKRIIWAGTVWEYLFKKSPKEMYDDLTMEIACGLHNFRVECRYPKTVNPYSR
jgi:hypothetical protein